VDVSVYGPGSVPLPNATFAIDNATGNEVYNATAPLPSFVHPVKVYTVDQDGIHTYTPHTFKAIHPTNGYRAVTRDVTGGASLTLRVLPRDMYIDSMAFSAGWALPDEEFTVSADVRNTGPGDVGPVAVRLLVASVTAGTDLDNRTVKLSGIPAGGNATAEFGAFSFAEPGTLEFTVIADPSVKYVETDGANNTLSSQFLINGRPVANLTVEDDQVLTGEEVVFNGSASADADGIASYRFVFGDGSSTGWSASPGATHTYADDGTYTASLWVQDTFGAQSSRASTLSVTILNRAPMASFTYAPDEGGSIETLFRFESTSADADGTVEGFSWDFGDGSASTDPEPSHTYGDDGEFTVTLTVMDDDGGVSPEFDMDVTVGNLLPTIVLTGEGTKGGIKYTGDVLKFDASGTRDPDDPVTLLSFSWEMGDGTTYTDAAVNHTYQEPGEYNVTITVEDDDSVSTDESTYATRTIHLIIRAGYAGPEEPEPEEEVEEEGSLGWAGEMWYVWVIVVVAVVGVLGMVLGRRDRTPVEMSMPLHCDHCDTYFPPEDLKEEDKCPECDLVMSNIAAEVVELTEAPEGPGLRGRRPGRP
jgi:PKD repeat protein